MNIIYCCSDGVYSSRIMAGIHLRQLPSDKIASSKEILSLQGFGNKKLKSGVVQYVGDDFYLNSIFTLAVKNDFKIVRKAIQDFLKLYSVSADKFMLVESPKISSPWITVGGYLHDMGFFSAGNKLVVNSIRRNYPSFVKKVKEVLAQLD
ncbi:MAG: hypothetical protein PWQ96_275 [Clostridia bacterium]|nr:hypothetical protein [Clostridia bacterium]